MDIKGLAEVESEPYQPDPLGGVTNDFMYFLTGGNSLLINVNTALDDADSNLCYREAVERHRRHDKTPLEAAEGRFRKSRIGRRDRFKTAFHEKKDLVSLLTPSCPGLRA